MTTADFLTARGTGTFRTAQLCESCRAVMESQGRQVPVAGDDFEDASFSLKRIMYQMAATTRPTWTPFCVALSPTPGSEAA